ncbi:hypothetical protein F0251_13470 [Vibrio sp. 070316B]|nr:hypothetical protein [Vibrio sp. 070316B]NOI88756.1 hypothetical protein [Vibrio sp. 99K-1]
MEPQRKLGLCCIWSLESVAFAVAAGMPVQSVRLPVPYFKTEPQRKLGLCCIWNLESVAFVVAAGMPVQSVRLNRYHI